MAVVKFNSKRMDANIVRKDHVWTCLYLEGYSPSKCPASPGLVWGEHIRASPHRVGQAESCRQARADVG